jgi:hypothetical protein
MNSNFFSKDEKKPTGEKLVEYNQQISGGDVFQMPQFRDPITGRVSDDSPPSGPVMKQLLNARIKDQPTTMQTNSAAEAFYGMKDQAYLSFSTEKLDEMRIHYQKIKDGFVSGSHQSKCQATAALIKIDNELKIRAEKILKNDQKLPKNSI